MQLFIKLSESIQILDKFRYTEQKQENMQWIGRNIFAFLISSLVTAFLMLLLGFGLTSGDKKKPTISPESQKRLNKL